MDLETSLYAFAWIAGFVIFLLRFGKLYRWKSRQARELPE